MNAIEVIANRANELMGRPLGTKSPVHPNDHVNASQSSNDSFPTVMHVVTVLELEERLKPSLALLRESLQERADTFVDVVKIARTHLMDAVPMTMGQSFDTFARQVAHGIDRVDATMPRLLSLPQGGTAAGTGLNAPPDFDLYFCEEISALTGRDFSPNASKFEGMAAHDALVEVSGALISSQKCRSKSGGAFKPVPAAVPPCGSDRSRGMVASIRSIPCAIWRAKVSKL